MESAMVKESQYAADVSELYSRLAWIYDLATDHEVAHHDEAVRIADVQASDQVLEVACGTGRGTVRIARHIGEDGRLYAVDLTEAMLERARRKLARRDLLDGVDLRLGDARELPFPDGVFDVVYNAYMFDLIDSAEIPHVVSEFTRVLKPGGKIVLVNMSKNTTEKTLYEHLHENGLLGFASGSCRPVLMQSFLEEAGYEKVKRVYRKNVSYFPLNWLHGTEIVWGYKASIELVR